MSDKMYTRDTFDSSLLHIMKRSPMELGKIQGGGGLGGTCIQPGSILKKVHFLAFLSKTIKKGLLLDFYAIKSSTF